MGRDGMAAKFADCAHATLTETQVKTALETIYRMEDLASVSELLAPVVG